MRRMLPIVLMVAGVAVCWVAGISTVFANQASITDIEEQIAQNEDLGTYKNALDLYDQVIAKYPDDISWYERKADAYYKMEYYKSFVSQCQTIASKFPDDALGYRKLMEYYQGIDDAASVIEWYKKAPDSARQDEGVLSAYHACEYAIEYKSGQYAQAAALIGGAAVVQGDGAYGYVDEKGKTLLDCKYQQAQAMLEDQAAVKLNDEWFIVDKEGDRVHATHDALEELYSPSEGMILAKKDGSYGYYDADLANPQHFEYEEATSFYNGVAAVKQNGKWALIDSNFNQITGFEFDDVIRDNANVCSRKSHVFASKDGSFRLLDLKGNRVGSESFEDAKLFFGAKAAVKQNGKWGFVSDSGAMEIACQYDDAESFAADMAPVKQGDTWGFIDASGNMVVQPEYTSATVVNNDGITAIGTGKGIRYIQFLKFVSEA